MYFMYPDPYSNPRLRFESTTEFPSFWKQYLLSKSKSTLYFANGCRILVQELYVENYVVWYFVLNVRMDDLLIRLILPPGLAQILFYNKQNNGEMIVLHQQTGLGLREMDYCYLGGGFSDKDLRILVSKGTYQTIAIPFSYQNQRTAITGMKKEETYAFIGKTLMDTGIPLTN